MRITVKAWRQMNQIQRLKLLEITVDQNWMGSILFGQIKTGSQTAKFVSRKG